MTTGERIKTKRIERGMSADELADIIGVSRSTIFRYENGDIEKFPVDRLEPIAKALNTSVAYLMGWENDTFNALSAFDNIFPIETVRIPFLGEIACGEPIYADEDRESYVLAGTGIKADFCLRAKGDSMINARILDGDIVFIRRQDIVENGEIAAVIINDEATLKRVYYYRDDNILILKPENPAFEDLIFRNEQLETIKILGKAVAFQSDAI